MGTFPFSKSIKVAAFVCFSLFVSNAAWALKPSHEADRLLIAAEQAFANNNRQQAAEHLLAAQQLGIALPVDYNFLYGKLLLQQGKTTQARRYLEQYVNREGDAGRYYRDALVLITESEKNRRPVTPPAKQSPGKAEITLANNAGSYVDRIQQLYAADSAANALVTHLNSLLKFYAYGDKRIVASSRTGTPSRHKVQFSSIGEIITYNKVGASANTLFKEDRFSVFGVNPHISYKCKVATSSCWLYHPITAQRWLQIVRNEDVALEISKAMSQLIKDLQKNS